MSGSSASRVLELCATLGFAKAGIAHTGPSERGPEFQAWLSAGMHGTMDWLAEDPGHRLDPARELPGVRAAIMVADVYALGAGSAGPDRASDEVGPARGRIARYAQGDDYHLIIKKRLHTLADTLRAQFPGHSFRSFVDTAPVLERELAARAGLGWVGKHTLIIDPDLGSWMLLGGILTTLEISQSAPPRRVPDHCGTCTRCIDACPTRAITPYRVDASRCISYLTIEHRGPVAQELREPLGDWLFGCDVCQDVCPHNRERTGDAAGAGPTSRPRPRPRPRPNPAYEPRRDGFDLLEVLGWNEDAKRSALTRSAMKRAKLEMWQRNALLLAGNALTGRGTGPGGGALAPEHARALRGAIVDLMWDAKQTPLVRQTAREVLASLERRGAAPAQGPA